MSLKKKKVFIRNIAMCLIAVLLAGMVLGSQSKVVQAKEVFLGVQKIRNEIINAPDETFIILEIVDKVSRFGEAGNANDGYEKIFDIDNFPSEVYENWKQEYEDGTKTDEEIKEEIGNSIELGEEEIGFLIGGSEPFGKLYQDLLELSRAYSNPKLVVFDDTIQTPEIPQADLVIMRAGYEALISKIPSSFFSENLATALMVKKEITSFQPDVEEYENYLRFVSDVTGEVEEGYMVEDPDGAYVWVGSDTMGQYVYVGDVNTPSLLLNYDYGEDSEVETDEEETDEETDEEETEEDDVLMSENNSSLQEKRYTFYSELPEDVDEKEVVRVSVDAPLKFDEEENGSDNEEQNVSEEESISENGNENNNESKSISINERQNVSGNAAESEVEFFAGNENEQPVRKIDKIYRFTFLGIENNEWFKNHVFGLEADSQEGEAKPEDLNITVVSCTPDDSTLGEKIRQADMVYLNADSFKSDASEADFTLLMEKITGVSKTPFVVKNSVYSTLDPDIDDGNLNEGHFVKDNIYVINHAINSVVERERLNDTITGIDVETAFEEVNYRMEQEKYEREQLGVDEWPSNTPPTPALAIQTILTYTDVPIVIEKSNLTVLELQPCNSFTYAGSEEKEQEFREKFLPKDSTVELEIIGMTTSEFCGKIEDINVKYDMIYLGANTDLMNRIQVSTGDYCTAYNDFNMYGIVYSHIGDLCHIGSAHSGLLTANECNTYRYSGNDILASQEEQLIDFLKSGAPIVVADDFFVKNQDGEILKINSGTTGTTVTDNNGKKDVAGAAGIPRQGILDSSSYIYQFVKRACVNNDAAYGDGAWEWDKRIYQNFMVAHEVDGENDIAAFAKWLNQPKMTIHMMSQPTEYNYTTRSENGCTVIADSSYLLPESNGYYLTYEFSISNLSFVDVASARYEALLWIDTNMDGKFSDNSENLSGDHFVVQNMETGEIVEKDDLKTGVRYRVRRQLPDEIVGALPWKLVVRNRENNSIRSAVTGLTAIRMTERPTIRVLQLYQGDSNIQNKMNTPGNVWNTLLSNVPDFNVEVTSIDASGYFNGTLREELDNYDMLIVGFADAYQLSTGFAQERLKEIIAYADSGKCVLFSHDNTNWKNNSNNTLNMYIRDLTGLDRYGVTVYRISNEELYRTKNVIKNGGSIPQNGLADSRQALTEAIFKDEMTAYKRDIAFAVNTDQRQMDSRTQGITYSGNEHDRISGLSDYIVFNNQKYGDYYRYLDFKNAAMNTWIDVAKYGYAEDYEVKKNNEGAITEYPYHLKDIIDIAPTHGQYYQLDLDSDKDGDGEGDIVVWYTLNNSVKGSMNDVYDYSPNDVRNNYYIYNRGNITYTGMGHRTIQNEEEIKLFINTMVAAYRVSILPPALNIIEGNGDVTQKNFDAIPVDMQIGNQTPFYKVYFKAQDINLVSDSAKRIRCRIYLEGGNQDLVVDGENIKVADKTNQAINGWKICETGTGAEVNVQYDAGTDSYYYILTSGKEYYVQAPLKEVSTGEVNLSETKSMNLYIEVQSFVQKYGKTNVSAYIYDSFKLSQVNLFDLD